MRLWHVAIVIMIAFAQPLIAQPRPTAAKDSVGQGSVGVSKQKRDPLLGEDKVHHALVSAFLAAAGYYVARDEAGLPKGRAVTLATSFSLSWGVAKEVYDKRSGRGHASVADLVADVAGIALGLALFAGHF